MSKLTIAVSSDLHISDWMPFSQIDEFGRPSRLTDYLDLADDFIKFSKDIDADVNVIAGDIMQASTVRPRVLDTAREFLIKLESGSLRGPLHGGANIKVNEMFAHLKKAIKHWDDVKEIDSYLKKMLNKEAYNKTGLIYCIGHSVYTISDPRSLLLKEMARKLAEEKGLQKEFDFLELLDERAVNAFMTFKGAGINKQVCTNVDFYSGFVYEAMGLPTEVYTPLFAMSRITGWTAHRIEELNFASKRIIRPAYKNVGDKKSFVPLDKR